MKKILLLLTLWLSLCAAAQNAVGDWRIHTSFVGDQVTSIAESRQWVYYQSGANLFRLDKSTSENEAMSIQGDLSDMGISNMYYNSDKDYLVVVYTNSNIDIILGDGSVVNMPEIKDAVMTYSKTINDVTFAPGLIYLATDFGYVSIDDSKFVVKESHIYGSQLISVAQMGDMLLLTSKDAFYYGKASKYYELLEQFETSTYKAGFRIRPLTDRVFLAVTGWTALATMTVDADGKATFDSGTLAEGATTIFQKTVGGYLINTPVLGKCFKIDNSGSILETIETPGEVCSAHPDGDGVIWAAGAKGLHQRGSENYYLPNVMTFATPYWMTYNQDRDLLYVSSPSSNALFPKAMPSYINTYDGMKWANATLDNPPAGGTYWIDFMPGDPDTYLIAGWTTGLHKVVDNKIVYTYNNENSPMVSKYAMHPITSIDRYGNVWVVQSYENEEHPVMVLPAAKAKQATVTASDWTLPIVDGMYTGFTKRASFLSTKRGSNDIKVFTDGDFQSAVVMWNSAGEVTGRPQQAFYRNLTDQDGQIFSWTYIMCLTEDLNGLVWMGTTEGVISFNPAKAFDAAFRINHIKVPRNDGTGMADYLMSGIQVNDIAVDGANRKWIATQTSGLFLVSADGTEIIKKFNTTNSPLASNTVYKVCCNPNSNSVYVTTPAGLYEYFSDSSPAETSFSNIYAYPNPVRPDFGGDVTITGLMDNSLVKIADASGNVIRQLKSTGGMTTWDCCDEYGNRVKTGVYMVICSRANGGSESVVTKIAVIR